MKQMIHKFLLKKNRVILNYNYPNKKPIFDMIKSLGPRLHLRGCEAYQIYTTTRDICKKDKGALAEVGMFEGGSAKLICEAKGNNVFYGFDTFEGLPEVQEIDKSKNKWECDFKKGEFKASFEDVKNFLKKYNGCHIYKGVFPQDNSKIIENKKFIFVHLDVDIYQSTKECLEFFYPRMEKGAVLISHDYSTSKGVKKAFDEFFKNKPEVIVELAGTQCMFVKL